MTTEIPGMQIVLDFIKRHQEHGVGSTGASVVTINSTLYNVDGSSYDPKRIPGHENESWKNLLIAYGIAATSACYATTPNAPTGSSHADFSVGGHVTTNANGTPLPNRICYLMPLCSWHNNSARDGQAFAHTQNRMLQLTGYMQGELAATFQLRLPSKNPYAILYYSEKEECWKHKDLTEGEAMNLKADFIPKITSGGEANYVLFERVGHGADTLHHIREVNLPGSEY